ncbi:beta-lactamase-like protein [Leucobacter sp. Psy1]|uniref:MBL fold metallo-hydrolase n=1 Tax=Leucobacter sp. Psy1 TaxID=2875729 RepID=UPI001CD27CAC|nr:MBL fold metallo-hydrolase [Leucobacter sp. Psy1]UBH06231.1 beta-lactamase-like protein [Leucobacter sp. Psy1]
MQLAPGLHRIGNDIVAVYLIVTEEGVTVIDAGLPGHWRELLDELAELGRDVEDIRGLILTHGDSDHVGFAERLRREHGVPVYIHSGDAARAKGDSKPKTSRPSMRIGPLLGYLAYAIRRGGFRTTWLTEVTEIRGGETLDLPGAPEIIALPGHSPGSIAVFSPSVDAVFVGDGLTTRHVLTGRRGPQPAPFTDDPEQALDSLERLRGAAAKWVLPGHGHPWSSGVDAAIAAVEAESRTAR